MIRQLDPNWDLAKEPMLQFLPFYHQFGFMNLTMSAVYGCPSIIFSSFNPIRFLEVIQDYKVCDGN